MSGSKPIKPKNSISSFNNVTRQHDHLSSSFGGPASFRSGSPLAQGILAQDIAAEAESHLRDEERGFGNADDDYDSWSATAADEDEAGGVGGGPVLYTQPSGVAYGYRRPSMLVEPGPPEPQFATSLERVQSRNAERSLLRDNHILPPKHATSSASPSRSRSRSAHMAGGGKEGKTRVAVSSGGRGGAGYDGDDDDDDNEDDYGSAGPSTAATVRSLPGRLYKRIFSTKVPPKFSSFPAYQDSNNNGDGGDDNGAAAPLPSETSPLLPSAILAATTDENRLDEQWDAAVASGMIRTTWQREAKTIWTYSRSLIVTFLLQYSINIASIFAVGRIGKLELGAVTLASMTANIICYAPIQGLSTSLDTLCAQAYGSGHKQLVGLQLQRMMYFLWLLAVPIAVVFGCGEQILSRIVPERESAELAGLYLRVIIVGIPGFIAFEGGKRFVQAQGLFIATTYVLLIAAPLNILVNWLFVWYFGWGFIGAPIAVAFTQTLMPILLLAYVVFIDGKQCWGGFSARALSNWGSMIRLALPGMIMVEAEWLAFEILTLGTSQFGTEYLAAQSILVTLTSTTFQIPFPVSIAASTRVANLIGAKLVDAAKTSAKVTVVAGCLIALINLTFLAALRYQLPWLFTQDEEVIALVAELMPLCAVMQIFDSMAAISHGLLRGIGKQSFGGYANLLVYYVVALPISFTTAFALDWKLMGLWSGVTLGLFIVGAVEFWYIYTRDWEQSVREAEYRNATG